MPRVPSHSPTTQRRQSVTAASDGPRQFVFVAASSRNHDLDHSPVSGSSSFQRPSEPTTHQEDVRGPDAERVAEVIDSLNRRQPPSCDACRTRKLKCAGRPTVIELGPEATAIKPCNHCREWNLECSYLYQRKRRGRKNRVVERLAEEQRARRKSHGGDGAAPAQERQDDGSSDSEDEREGPSGRREVMDGAQPAELDGGYQLISDHTSLPRNSLVDSRNFPHSPTLPLRHAYQQDLPPSATHTYRPNVGDVYHLPIEHPRHIPDRSFSFSEPSHNPVIRPTHTQAHTHGYNALPSEHVHDYGLHSALPPVLAPGVAATSTSPNNEVSPSIAISEASIPPTTSIEAILPRDLAMLTVRLYFDHVYCIIPFIHRPSFMVDLLAREEERRPLFFALVMAMIATTLIHVPKSFFPIPAESVRRLSDTCLKACSAVTVREMNNPTVDLVCIKYFAIVVHNKHGNAGLEAAAFGEAQYLAITLGLHREDSYQGLNPIESERRRRVWFLIHNADKFEGVSRSKPILIRSDEFMGPESTNFPAELDDKSITAQGYLPSSIPVPLICGFNIMTRTDSIMGDILIHERDIRRRPPTDPEGLLSALRHVRQLQQRIKQIVDRLPRPFQLAVGAGQSLPAPGWEEAIRDELDLFFSDPTSSETAKDGYLVLKANIHVTLAMTRLRLILHREDLLNRSGQPGTPSRNAAELVAADLGEQVDWRQGVYQDLFKAVHGIPIQALAANGPSLVTKIRVVAVTLLDALPAQDQVDPNVQGIAAYLLDFLNIMTSIESQFAD